MSPQRLPPSFSLIRLTVWEQTLFQDFHKATMEAILEIGMERI